jgi:hypothetical protein
VASQLVKLPFSPGGARSRWLRAAEFLIGAGMVIGHNVSMLCPTKSPSFSLELEYLSVNALVSPGISPNAETLR